MQLAASIDEPEELLQPEEKQNNEIKEDEVEQIIQVQVDKIDQVSKVEEVQTKIIQDPPKDDNVPEVPQKKLSRARTKRICSEQQILDEVIKQNATEEKQIEDKKEDLPLGICEDCFDLKVNEFYCSRQNGKMFEIDRDKNAERRFHNRIKRYEDLFKKKCQQLKIDFQEYENRYVSENIEKTGIFQNDSSIVIEYLKEADHCQTQKCQQQQLTENKFRSKTQIKKHKLDAIEDILQNAIDYNIENVQMNRYNLRIQRRIEIKEKRYYSRVLGEDYESLKQQVNYENHFLVCKYKTDSPFIKFMNNEDQKEEEKGQQKDDNNSKTQEEQNVEKEKMHEQEQLQNQVQQLIENQKLNDQTNEEAKSQTPISLATVASLQPPSEKDIQIVNQFKEFQKQKEMMELLEKNKLLFQNKSMLPPDISQPQIKSPIPLASAVQKSEVINPKDELHTCLKQKDLQKLLIQISQRSEKQCIWSNRIEKLASKHN
ncbi:UNKNOWN [Stylonychia lemnae]|uniref:Uncharacterized protein n=1 Tax=Stylonychia lemnae TaxID=5949 RepID=A0A078B899_STYLE|nr:UNKNOWN [Stylonychia lemnae]|eukprot:CDW90745.1 UNKNOWN [Stylonychia lemnae]